MAAKNKYRAARVIMRRKLINDNKISFINKELDNILVLISTNWDTFGWINTDAIAELLSIPLQRGISSNRIAEEVQELIEQIHDRNSFCSCLR